MEKLFFSNAEFKPGQNYTVRLGTKWKDKIDINDVVWIEAFPADHIGQIHEIVCCRLDQIPERVFENEHDEKCRDFDGLFETLKSVYEEFKDVYTKHGSSAPVTCIGFTVYRSDLYQTQAAKE